MGPLSSKSLLLILVLALPPGEFLAAGPVPDLYMAEVNAQGLSGPGLEEAFARALGAVVLKVTGDPSLAADPGRLNLMGSPEALVQQYQPLSGGQVRVSFDPGAVRRRLDALKFPVWADNRPLTLVLWPGSSLPGAGAPVGAPSSGPGSLLLSTAASRGVPVRLVVTEDGRLSVPGTPSPGPWQDPEGMARAAGADLLLVVQGLAVGGPESFRWTLVQGLERAEWQGDAAAGANGLADRLAARYATSALGSQVLEVGIEGVDSFDDYGRVQHYFNRTEIIQSLVLRRVEGSLLIFEVGVRGNVNQLNDAFALQKVLEPASTAENSPLRYRLLRAGEPLL